MYSLLQINNSITQLNLAGNALGDEGISYIQKMMEDNNSITDIVSLGSCHSFCRFPENDGRQQLHHGYRKFGLLPQFLTIKNNNNNKTKTKQQQKMMETTTSVADIVIWVFTTVVEFQISISFLSFPVYLLLINNNYALLDLSSLCSKMWNESMSLSLLFLLLLLLLMLLLLMLLLLMLLLLLRLLLLYAAIVDVFLTALVVVVVVVVVIVVNVVVVAGAAPVDAAAAASALIACCYCWCCFCYCSCCCSCRCHCCCCK